MAKAQPDPKKLPTEKKTALTERIAESVRREAVKEYKNLREHEVGKSDARDIIYNGVSTGRDRADRDASVDK